MAVTLQTRVRSGVGTFPLVGQVVPFQRGRALKFLYNVPNGSCFPLSQDDVPFLHRFGSRTALGPVPLWVSLLDEYSGVADEECGICARSMKKEH